MVSSAWGQSWGGSWGNAWGVVDPPEVGGGSGKAGPSRKNKKIKGWTRERKILEESLLKFSPEHHDDLLSISKTLSQSNRPQANRIARKLEDYRGEIDQIQSLQKEIAKLQIAFGEKTIKTQMQEEMDLELKSASHQLFEILQDEDDAITSIILTDEMENRILLTLLGVKLH